MRRALHLASTSPRRRALLRQAGIDFSLLTPGPEPVGEGGPRERAELRARAKALGAPAPKSGGLVLAVDTVVEIDGQELGKPSDRAAAAAMLSRLRGAEHRVLTAHCLLDLDSGEVREHCAVATVRCGALSDVELGEYLDAGDWHDKAGAYGIQGTAGRFMQLVAGDLDTVIGLHVATVARWL